MAKLIRTFIAVELSPEVCGRAARLQQSLAESGASVRWVQKDKIHLTVKFLGEIEDVQVPAVCDTVRQVARATEPFELEIAGVGAFPNRDRPRTLWIGIASGAEPLTAMHRLLEESLAELGFRPEERRFAPHVTIGRLRKSHDSHRLAAALAEKTNWKGGAVAVDEMVVMASELTPEGPQYTVMGRGSLGG